MVAAWLSNAHGQCQAMPGNQYYCWLMHVGVARQVTCKRRGAVQAVSTWGRRWCTTWVPMS